MPPRRGSTHRPTSVELSPASAETPAKAVPLSAFHKPHKYDATGCPIYTRAEVWADTAVHAVGVPFAFGASRLLLLEAYRRAPQVLSAAYQRRLAGLWVYSASLCVVLTVSAVYNIVGCGVKVATAPLRRMDHACIYLAIAGSFTPFLLEVPSGAISSYASNDAVLAGIWAVALGGFMAKIILARNFETAGLALYGILAASMLILVYGASDSFAGGAGLLREFRASSVCYLFGLIFYLDDDVPYSNALWHACVLAGTVSHWRIVYHTLAEGNLRFPLPPLP